MKTTYNTFGHSYASFGIQREKYTFINANIKVINTILKVSRAKFINIFMTLFVIQ